MTRGPNRVPTRKLDAVSIGIPRMATSAPLSLSQSGHAGWRANVARPTKGKSIRSAVLRLVLSVVIAMSFPPTADTPLRRPDGLVVQQIWSVNLARWNLTQNESCAADVAYHGGFICPVDLATQSTHMNIDKVRLRNKFVVPYVFEEGCARQQLVDPLHHVLEQNGTRAAADRSAGRHASRSDR